MNKLLAVCMVILALGAIGYGLYSYNTAQQTLQKPEPSIPAEVVATPDPTYSPLPHYSIAPRERMKQIAHDPKVMGCTKNTDCSPYKEVLGSNDSGETEIIRYCANTESAKKCENCSPVVPSETYPISCECVENLCSNAD